MAIFRGSGSSLIGSAIDPTEALLDSDFTVNGILVRTGSGVYSTTPDNSANWDTAYSWGDWSVGVDKSFVDGLNVDADTLDSQEGTWYLDRANHTGTQTLSTISDSGTAAEADIVGTVSQSGGTPTGAIIEQGSNSNGEYTKFADGTVLFAMKLTLNYAVGATLSSGTKAFPVACTASPALAVALDLTASNFTPDVGDVTGPTVNNIDANSVNLRLHRITGMTSFSSGDTAEVHVIGRGRWFQ